VSGSATPFRRQRNCRAAANFPGVALWTRDRQFPHGRRSPSRLTRNAPAPYPRNDTKRDLSARIAKELDVARHVRETIHQPDERRGSVSIQDCFASEGALTMNELVTMVHGIRPRRPRFRSWGRVALIARCSDADAESPRWPLACTDVDVLTGLKCGLARVAR
jgi:hypothetical protein